MFIFRRCPAKGKPATARSALLSTDFSQLDSLGIMPNSSGGGAVEGNLRYTDCVILPLQAPSDEDA